MQEAGARLSITNRFYAYVSPLELVHPGSVSLYTARRPSDAQIASIVPSPLKRNSDTHTADEAVLAFAIRSLCHVFGFLKYRRDTSFTSSVTVVAAS